MSHQLSEMMGKALKDSDWDFKIVENPHMARGTTLFFSIDLSYDSETIKKIRELGIRLVDPQAEKDANNFNKLKEVLKEALK